MGALRETNLGETTRGDGRFALSVRDESSQLLDANVLEKHVRRKVTFHVHTKNNKITNPPHDNHPYRVGGNAGALLDCCALCTTLRGCSRIVEVTLAGAAHKTLMSLRADSR